MIEKWVRKGYRLLIAPRSQDEDSRRHEFILNVILCGAILLVAILNIYVFRYSIMEGNVGRGVSFWAFSALSLSFIGLLWLSRKGWFYLSSYLLIGLYTAGTIYSAYIWGFDLPQAVSGFVTAIIISSILIGTRFGLIMTLALCSFVFVVGSLQINGRIESRDYWRSEAPDTNDPLQQSLAFLLIMSLSWLSNREIERSLIRARSSEKALKSERDLLEIKVEERTREIRELQIEKISQLYRFAEFGRLSSGIFHDLINPLTAVSLNVQRLNDDGGPRVSETKEFLERAMRASKRMEAFILTVEKQIHSGDTDTEFSVADEIREAVALLQYKARKNSVDVEFVCHTEPLLLRGNPIRLHQIVTNLISNAVDAFDETSRDKRLIRITLNKNGNRVVLEFSDNGSGIPLEVQEKIFEPFFTTKAFHKGNGLGLSTTKRAVEKDFHGSIRFKTSPEGTTFTVLIPQTN